VAKAEGDSLQLTQLQPRRSGRGVDRREFTGKRIPALPPKPDLSKVRYGKPIVLFDGKSLDGWKLTNPHAKSAWSVRDGVLVNNPVQKPGQPRIHYGNLCTVAAFEDFNLTLEVNVPKGGNSGIYLRGIYEIQVSDSYGRPLDSHNMGGVYSRIAPRVAAEKPAGQWQTFDITLLDRHVTVKLNGMTITTRGSLMLDLTFLCLAMGCGSTRGPGAPIRRRRTRSMAITVRSPVCTDIASPGTGVPSI